MSELVQYLKENNINKFKIFHKRITNADIFNENELNLDVFDKVPTTMKKRAVYFMLNNVNIIEHDRCRFHNITEYDVAWRELQYFKLIQQHQYMKTMSNYDIYMLSFDWHPTHSDPSSHTLLQTLILQIKKNNSDENFNLGGSSSITYAVQYV